MKIAVVSDSHHAIGELEKLLSYLDKERIKHLVHAGHWNPFGHAQVTFKMHAPIFVWRQITRSRRTLVEGLPDDLYPIDVTNITELSKRYNKDKPENFYPESWRKKGGGVVTRDEYRRINVRWWEVQGALEEWINICDEIGVVSEQKRMRYPVDRQKNR